MLSFLRINGFSFYEVFLIQNPIKGTWLSGNGGLGTLD